MSQAVAIAAVVATRLTSGALTTGLMKVLFATESAGLDDEPRAFERPIFMVLAFNLVLAALGLADSAVRVLRRFAGIAAPDDVEVELGRTTSFPRASTGLSDEVMQVKSAITIHMAPEVPYRTQILLVAIPALFDLATQVLTNFALLFLPASISFLTRVGGIIFTTIIHKVVFARGQSRVQLLGICLCCLGLALGGAATSFGSHRMSGSMVGVSLALLGQLVGALQAVAEECLLKEFKMRPMQVLGWEGFWACLALIALQPVIGLLPGRHGFLDSAVMLVNSPRLLVLFLACLSTGMVALSSALYVTHLLSSVHRKLLNPAGGMLVWIHGLVAYYAFHSQSVLARPWTQASCLEAAGFLFILLGLLTHGGLLPWAAKTLEKNAVEAGCEADGMPWSEGCSSADPSAGQERCSTFARLSCLNCGGVVSDCSSCRCASSQASTTRDVEAAIQEARLSNPSDELDSETGRDD